MAAKIRYNGKDITQDDFDLAVEWMQATAPDQGGKMTRLQSSANNKLRVLCESGFTESS